MSFFQRYELLRLLENGEARTFRARQRDTERVVLLHMLPLGKGGDLATRVQRAGPDANLLEVGEFSGLVYAVTEAVEPFPGLRAWLDGERKAAPPAVPPVADVATRSKALDMEFESLFADEPPAPPSPPKAAPAPSPESPEPKAATLREPGEFTRMFSVPKLPPEQPLPDLLGEEKAAPQADTPGFTAMFEALQPRASAPDLVDPLGGDTRKMQAEDVGGFTQQFFAGAPGNKSNPASSDEFDKFFGPGLQGDAMNIEAEQAKQAQSPQPNARPFAKPGKFTKVFGPGGKREGQPPPPPVTRRGGGTGGSVSAMFAVPNLTTQAPPTPNPEPAERTTKGEYTRLMQAYDPNKGKTSPPAEPAAAPPPPDDNAAKRKKLFLWIGIGVGVATLLAVILILLLRK